MTEDKPAPASFPHYPKPEMHMASADQAKPLQKLISKMFTGIRMPKHGRIRAPFRRKKKVRVM